MARDGDPAKEPGNPDGCRISKKQVRQIGTSLAGLAEMFVRASNLIESSVRSITSQLANIKVGSGKAKGAGEGSKSTSDVTYTPTENLEKSAAKIAKKQQSEAIKSAGEMLNVRANLAEQEEKEIIKAAMRGLSARNAIRLAAEKAEAKAKADEEKEIIKAAINGQKARDRIRKAEEKQKEDERKEIEKKAPIAYGLGKAFGFLTGSILKIGSDIAPQISKAAKGLFAPKEMAPEESANLEQDYLRYERTQKIDYLRHEGAPKREERARRRRETPVDPLAIKEQEYNARKGVSKPPRGFSNGGQAKGTDTVPAMLTPGEYVVNRDATKKNRGILESINKGTQYYAAGGLVGLAGKGIAAAGRGVAAAGRGAAAGAEMAGMSRLSNAINAVTTAMAPVAPAFQAVNYAVLGGVDAFSKLTSFAGSFVSAVNPALMQQLGLAFKDLQAVIGVGLQPIIAAAIPIVRAFADSLQPVMQALLPTFDQFAQSMISLSGPIISLVIEAFAALEPVMATVTAAVEAWAAILTSLAPVISTVFKEVIYRITQVATTFQWLVGKLLSWIPGTGDAGKKLMESADSAQKTADLYYQGQSNVQKAVKAPVQKGAAAGAAAQAASFKGISEFGKGLMQAAFSSSTQAAALKTAEYSEKTYNELTKMNAQLGRANPAAPAKGVRGGP